LLNGSFLDVLPHVQHHLDATFDVVTGPEFSRLSAAEKQTVLARVEVVFGPGGLSREELDAAPCLKVISLASSGYESIDVEEATARGIVVTNAPTALGTESVADLTFGLILDVARQISRTDGQLRTGVWQRPLGTVVWGKTLGIIGLGRIGRSVAKRARGFSMTVLTREHHIANPPAFELGVQGLPLEELLQRSDFVSLHSRYSEATHHLIGRNELRMMKPSAFLINTSRPGIVDPAALREALTEGRIAGAGLDVYDGEPSTNNPLIGLPNVVVTSHIGNRTLEGVIDVVECSIRNALAVVEGREPEYVVVQPSPPAPLPSEGEGSAVTNADDVGAHSRALRR
jgi:lactate dehydrogenase-like 2-hydroxyacid dehydrogenase